MTNTETADFLTEITREARDAAGRHGFDEARDGSGELERYSFSGSPRAVFRVESEAGAKVVVEVEDRTGLEPEVEWSEELDGRSFLRNHEDPAADYLDALEDLLVTAKRRL